MESDMSTDQLENRVTRLEANFAGMAESLKRIEGMLSDVVTVAKQLASLEQSHGSQTRGLERAFGELDKLKMYRESDGKEWVRMLAEHMKEDSQRHDEMAEESESLKKEIGELKINVEKKTSWAEGALSAARLWWAASGIVIMSVLGWVALKVLSMSDAILLLQQRVGG